jgi:hypothetical protein
MFRVMVSPISGALDCVYSFWYNAPTMLPVAGSLEGPLYTEASRLPAGNIVDALYHKL